MRMIDRTNQVIGKFRIIKLMEGARRYREVIWICECVDCGMEKEIMSRHFTPAYLKKKDNPLHTCSACKLAERELRAKIKEENKKYNKKIVYDGQSLTVIEWAKRFGVSKQRIYQRIHRYGNPIGPGKQLVVASYKGFTRPLKWWAAKLNIPYWDIYQYGLVVDDGTVIYKGNYN